MDSIQELENLPTLIELRFADTKVCIVTNVQMDEMRAFLISPREQKWLSDWVVYSNENLAELLAGFSSVLVLQIGDAIDSFKTLKSTKPTERGLHLVK